MNQIMYYFLTNRLKAGYIFTPSLSNINMICLCILQAPQLSP